MKADRAMFDNVALLAGGPEVLEARPVRAFDEGVLNLLSDVSARLLKDPEACALPDVVSFAFWCRKANLARLAQGYSDASHRIGRGIAFHIAPSNVPVNFAFSWAFSQIAGNVDIVRVPSKPFIQVEVICRAVKASLDCASAVRSAFIRYPVGDAATGRLSEISDARIIWGGDTTVAEVRALPCAPRCIDVVFPDRYSVALIDESALACLDDRAIEDLAGKFYNDAYLMDQNACSSPRTIFWLGSDPLLRDRLREAVRAKAKVSYGLQGAVSVDKYVRLCEDAAAGLVCQRVSFDGCLTAVPLGNLPDDFSELRGYGGFFYEAEADSIGRALEVLGPKCQTVTYFGIDPEEVRKTAIEAGCSGVDRIVPVGKAMDIGAVWDGYDLPLVLSRVMEVVG